MLNGMMNVAQKVFGGGVATFEATMSDGQTGYGKLAFVGNPDKLDVEKATAEARRQAEAVLPDGLEIEEFEFVGVE